MINNLKKIKPVFLNLMQALYFFFFFFFFFFFNKCYFESTNDNLIFISFFNTHISICFEKTCFKMYHL